MDDEWAHRHVDWLSRQCLNQLGNPTLGKVKKEIYNSVFHPTYRNVPKWLSPNASELKRETHVSAFAGSFGIKSTGRGLSYHADAEICLFLVASYGFRVHYF